MKKTFESPNMELLPFEPQDMIATSAEPELPGGGSGGGIETPDDEW